MASRSRWDPYEREQEELRRYGLEHDPYADFVQELELADRYAEQASLAPGHPLARALARYRLGGGPSSLREAAPADPGRGARARRAGGASRTATASARPAAWSSASTRTARPWSPSTAADESVVELDRLEREAA